MSKETVIITCNNYSKKKSFVVSFNVGQKVFSFRMPTEFSKLYQMFKELAEREGISKSQLTVKAICEYVHRHYPGNPQLPLTKFTHPQKQADLPKNPEKEKTRKRLIFAIKHAGELSPKARRYYTNLAMENQDLEEAAKLLKLLSNRETEPCVKK